MNVARRGRDVAGCLLAACAAGLLGCGEGDDGPATHPVTGVVTLEGKPVEGATVMFRPLAGEVVGQATTDGQGQFEASIELDLGKRTKQGLPAGEYGVSVIKMETPGGGSAAAPFASPPRNVLPQKYADFGSSGLERTVEAGKPNHFELRLSP
jgi:hypothetical protein